MNAQEGHFRRETRFLRHPESSIVTNLLIEISEVLVNARKSCLKEFNLEELAILDFGSGFAVCSASEKWEPPIDHVRL